MLSKRELEAIAIAATPEIVGLLEHIDELEKRVMEFANYNVAFSGFLVDACEMNDADKRDMVEFYSGSGLSSCLDAFFLECREKLLKKKRDGYSGWDGGTKEFRECLTTNLLRNLVHKDYVDVAMLAMFLWNSNNGCIYRDDNAK